MTPLTLHGNTIDAEEHGSNILSQDASKTRFILLEAETILQSHERLELTNLGVSVQTLVANDEHPTYLCKYEPADLGVLRKLPFVKRAYIYHPDWVVHSDLKVDDGFDSVPSVQTKDSGPHEDEPLVMVEVLLHEDTAEHGDDVFAKLQQRVSDTSSLQKLTSSTETLRLWMPPRNLPDLAAIDCVLSVHPALNIQPLTVKARTILDLPPARWTEQMFHAPDQEFQGAGQIVAVSDTGLDEGNWTVDEDGDWIVKDGKGVNEAFKDVHGKSRVVNRRNESRLGEVTVSLADDDERKEKNPSRYSHGTHVAGCVLGVHYSKERGLEDADVSMGSAPAAKIFVQAMKQDSFTAIANEFLYAHELVAPPLVPLVPKGTKPITIQNNSWDRGVAGEPVGIPYKPHGAETDRWTFSHNEALIVFAAGNDGDELCKWNYARGRKTQQLNRQIGGHASSKNVLTVGASWSTRNMVKANTERDYDTSWCGDHIMHNEKVLKYAANSGVNLVFGHETGKSVAAFSSKGPTHTGFLKPDIVAPGVGILSTVRGKKKEFLQKFDAYRVGKMDDKDKDKVIASLKLNSANPSSAIEYKSGTSMAAPLVSGIAACLKEAIISRKLSSFHGPTLRAILINGAISCKGGSFWYVGKDGNLQPKLQLGNPPDCIQGHGLVNYDRSLRHITSQTSDEPPETQSTGHYQDTTGVRAVSPADRRPPDRFFRLGDSHKKFYVTLVYNDAAGELLQFELKLSVTLQAYKPKNAAPGQELQIRDIVTQKANEVNMYPECPPGETEMGKPIISVGLGTVQKVYWEDATIDNLGEDEGRRVKISIALFGASDTSKANYSLAWLSED